MWVGYRQAVQGQSVPRSDRSPSGDRAGKHRAWRANTARSRYLFAAFLAEQSDPDRFYQALASDSAAQVDAWHPLTDALVVDVGGGPGYFEDAFTRRGARYIAVDADAGEMRLHGRTPSSRTVQADGTSLPFGDATFDVAYSSNVAEHVREPWSMADEMVRVVRPGGTVVFSYTLWWGPWGGHETSPWHLLGGEFAARRYSRRHGREPKNRFGDTLFAAHARDGIRWARQAPEVEVLGIVPRYLPGWAAALMRIPIVREVLCWNVMIICRRVDSVGWRRDGR